MKFTRDTATAIAIRTVSASGIRIGDDTYAHAIALTSSDYLGAWEEKSIGELTSADFDDLLESKPELIILGTGETNIFAPKELVFAFARQGIGFEVMDTAAAARTFNVLAGENRRVAAVLYL